jgi:hypothetical protein
MVVAFAPKCSVSISTANASLAAGFAYNPMVSCLYKRYKVISHSTISPFLLSPYPLHKTNIYCQTATFLTYIILFAPAVVAAAVPVAAAPPSVATAVPVSEEKVSLRFKPVG